MVQVASVSGGDSLSGLVGDVKVTASSSEADSRVDAEDVPGDVLVSGGDVQVRAERYGYGPGRTYTITATAIDRAGNSVVSGGVCTVPHDQRIGVPR